MHLSVLSLLVDRGNHPAGVLEQGERCRPMPLNAMRQRATVTMAAASAVAAVAALRLASTGEATAFAFVALPFVTMLTPPLC
jgi:hypothetical protein